MRQIKIHQVPDDPKFSMKSRNKFYATLSTPDIKSMSLASLERPKYISETGWIGYAAYFDSKEICEAVLAKFGHKENDVIID